MIYTIGHVESYLKAIANSPDGKIQKAGKYPGYTGGYAFQSIADAQRCIDESHPNRGYGVFGLNADWETDTEPALNGWWHVLVNNADIIVLNNKKV